FGFNFDKYLDKVWVKGLITKNRQTDFFSTPDRLFSSGVLGMQLFKQLSLTYTLASSFDVAKTAMFSNQKFSNTVHSIGIIEEKETNKYKLYLS
uniref:hypothetical protein n=1 Tax=Umezakia ovalisporum TaxID=75695 RepID=UPI0039C68BD3